MNLFAIAKVMPLLAVVTLAVIALFNIGYFWEVGLHFIGIVDISNIVYSFGLFFPLVVGSTWLALADVVGDLLMFTKQKGAYEKFSRFAVLFVFPFAMLAAIVWAFAWYKWGWAAPWSLITLAALLWTFYNVINLSARYYKDRTFFHRDVTATAVSLVIFILLTGRTVAYSHTHHQRATYTIATTDVTLLNARIIRSSSNGFLVVSGERVMFVPSGQIKLIRADQDVTK